MLPGFILVAMSNLTISTGCDHAGFPYKQAIIDLLKSKGLQVTDFGTNSKDSVDYPDYVHPAMEAIESGRCQMGVLICGSANGVAMTANRHQGIRAAICWEEEIAALARQHNDANVICIPARFVSSEKALKMIETFLSTDFEGGRHQNRVNKISC